MYGIVWRSRVGPGRHGGTYQFPGLGKHLPPVLARKGFIQHAPHPLLKDSGTPTVSLTQSAKAQEATDSIPVQILLLSRNALVPSALPLDS